MSIEFHTENAAVFFVDILGMSALTNREIDVEGGLVKLVDPEIYTFSRGGLGKDGLTNQTVAAWLLMQFREVLEIIETKHNVEVSQLSDCAFIWSSDIPSVLLAASEFMWSATTRGLLCRGGLCYGEVITPQNIKESIGRFVLGDAITRAAKLESLGKGCRIFTDDYSVPFFHTEFPGHSNPLSNGRRIGQKIFSPILNPLNYTVVDEFKWYCFHDLGTHASSEDGYSADAMALRMALLVGIIKHSPYFAWNAMNKHGELQLAASIDSISSSIELHTGHNKAQIQAEYLIGFLKETKRSFDAIAGFFGGYHIDALTSEVEEELRLKMATDALSILPDSEFA